MRSKHSSRAAAGTLARAAWRSLRSGFGTVDPQTYARRLEACHGCEFCVPAPPTLLHALARPGDPKVCDLCGCFVFKKARYLTEHCPAAAPGDPALSRWSEALAPPALRERP